MFQNAAVFDVCDVEPLCRSLLTFGDARLKPGFKQSRGFGHSTKCARLSLWIQGESA
jgi:hypothetical protein